MDQSFFDRLSWWHFKAKKEEDHWLRFVLYYFIFDAYLSEGSQSGKDSAKIDWFINNKNSLKDSFSGNWTAKLLPQILALKSLSPIKDMRPGSTTSVYLNNENDLEEAIKFIYQIRCNLFHGSKDLVNDRDSNLVYYAGDFLREAIGWWLVSRD